MDNNTLSEIKKICYEEGYKSGTRAEIVEIKITENSNN